MTATTFDQFDQMERRADRTLAVVYWVKHVKNVALCAASMAAVDFVLRQLIKSLSAEHLEALSAEQAAELTKKLQDLHHNLVGLFRCGACNQLSSSRLFRSSIKGLEASTEDLEDVIEDLVMSEDPRFKALVADCVTSIPPAPAELVGRM